MIDVLEAARRTGKDPETIRRWIRSGKLRAQKIGLKHMIDEADLPERAEDHSLALPPSLQTMMDGGPMPDVAAWIRVSREGH